MVGDVPAREPSEVLTVIIDCDSCAARGPACGDCVVSVLLGPPEWMLESPGGTTFQPVETAALAVLADSGLVPPLRLVPTSPVDNGDTPGTAGRAAV